MKSCGINIGSSSIKIVVLQGDKILRHKVVDHEGNFAAVLKDIFTDKNLFENAKALVTGAEGRYLLNINNVIESVCIEEVIKAQNLDVDAVVCLGGENFVVYSIDDNCIITNSFSGNKCASGTGEFLKQQLGRMDMCLDDICCVSDDANVHKLSSRCSVFMKSDCTHKLNKGEATKHDVVVSLSDVMATKVVDFLKKAKIRKGRVLFTGGVTANKFIVRYVKEKMPHIDFIVPDNASYFEAYGAALLARNYGSMMPPVSSLFRDNEVQFERFESLKNAHGKVRYIKPHRGQPKEGREYILGVDGGSTTTKVALIDYETEEIAASHYGRTHGDPVKALKECLVKVKEQLKHAGVNRINISLASTTGSSREILGVFLETPAVYNEIIAHSTGTAFFNPDVDTIFEIGGQDAKYAFLKNKVPIDYAMNEACSAGTGSFLEESASGDLNITDVRDIGSIALAAQSPLKFGEHCSAFINSDIRKAIQQGANREDITAGIITSIVSNYLNRVVGNRSIGSNIALQGGVALNKAVPLAFAMLMNKDITVPPDPELLGCFGVGLLAKQKHKENLIEKNSFNIDKILNTEIIYEKEFRCKACENNCPIRTLKVNDNKYMFGGRCNKYANIRKKKNLNENEIVNYIQKREQMLFEDFAPDKNSFIAKRNFTIGVPRAFSVYTLWPLYSWFFHTLGIKIKLSDKICSEGIARTEGSYCFPAEIAHGAVQDIVDSDADFIFVPHFRDMESYEKNTHACFCPITQSLPYYIKKAFPEIPEEKFLAPIISFKYGLEKTLEEFVKLGKRLGINESEIISSFKIACQKQKEFFTAYRSMGEAALEEAKAAKRPVIAVLGRPYNAFTADANMGIPLKFASRGYSVIPFDMLPFENEEIFENMYWYYGQEDMKAAVRLKNEDNIYITYITNFSCAPDSFMLHYMKWIMGTKPFLVLELDSHSADAGIDTRVEAFLDIIEGYRTKFTAADETPYDNGYRFINNGKDKIHVINIKDNRRIEIFGNKKVKLLLANMGRLSAELMAASVRSVGINAEALPFSDRFSLQIARSYMSGKECLPSQLVLGGALKYLSSDRYRKDELYLLFVPTTQGPCRTGQYYVFYENLFKDLRLENVVIVKLDSENSYNELGATFTKSAFWGLTVADYMKDIETTLRACAADPVSAIEIYDELWKDLLSVTEKGTAKQKKLALEKIANGIADIPLKLKPENCSKVLVVGEIYVRRDDFAVDELIKLIGSKGIIAKVSGITEWLYYCDYTRRHDIVKRLKLLPLYRRLFSKEIIELILWHIEALYKHSIENKIKEALSPCGLLIESPDNMKSIMDNAHKHFVTDELYSEISISSGVASTAMSEEFSGVINISPFACLIGRVIEGLLTPWFRDKNYPLISVEIDGEILPPSIVNKLDIFILNVLRFKNKNVQLIEDFEKQNESISRKIKDTMTVDHAYNAKNFVTDDADIALRKSVKTAGEPETITIDDHASELWNGKQ